MDAKSITDISEIPPLRKKDSNGGLYRRRQVIEEMLVELSKLPFEELATRLKINDRRSVIYIPSEVLVYWLRITKHDKTDTRFNMLYPLLEQRVRNACPHMEIRLGKYNNVQEFVFERVVNLLLRDRLNYETNLDIYEVVFDRAIAKLRSSAIRHGIAKDTPLESLEDKESGEIKNEVEGVINLFQPVGMTREEKLIYRFQLRNAIDSLPTEERRVIDMQEAGFLDQSEDSELLTISKLLNRTPKTIRAIRMRAYQKIRKHLNIEVKDA